MRAALATLLALGLGCFDPTFTDQTRCSHAGECPSGRECIGGSCQSLVPEHPDAPAFDGPVVDAPPGVADAPPVVDAPPTGGFTQPPGTVAVNFSVDDTANAIYGDGDLAWKAALIYDSATRIIAASTSWDGPWPPLFDDGPWNEGDPPGHEPIGAVAGDHRWGVTVFATPPATGSTRYEYGLVDLTYERAFGNGWLWGASGAFDVPAGATQPITAPGRSFPAFGAIDLRITLDTRALDDRRAWDTSKVTVKSSIWGWGALPMVIGEDGKASLTLSPIAGPANLLVHTGLLDVGHRAEVALFLGAAEVAYVDSRTHALTRGLTIAIQRPGASGFVPVPFSVEGQNVAATISPPGPRLTVEIFGGDDHGVVTSVPEGLSCPPTCTVEFPPDAAIVLSATPLLGAGFAGWPNVACPGLGTCTLTPQGNTFVVAQFLPPNTMFVTSTTHNGNLGGLAGADQYCQSRATAVGLPGTYRAWLSTFSVNARARLGSAAGWVRMDGRPFANTIDEVGDGNIFFPPRIDELGQDLGTVLVVTNTTLGGIVHPNSGGDCAGFTSASAAGTGGGFSSASSYMFENYAYQTCAEPWHLYCFGVDRAVRLAPAPLAGARKAFQRFWTPGGGIASADAACQSAAETAGLPGNFRALLATSTASALSRFNLSGPPWARASDGQAILPTAAAWASATYFDTGPNVTADGVMRFGNYAHWAGAASITAQGNATSTCDDWTNRDGRAAIGVAGDTRIGTLFDMGTLECSSSAATITCLEQ